MYRPVSRKSAWQLMTVINTDGGEVADGPLNQVKTAAEAGSSRPREANGCRFWIDQKFTNLPRHGLRAGN